jgi:hypothetical protein
MSIVKLLEYVQSNNFNSCKTGKLRFISAGLGATLVANIILQILISGDMDYELLLWSLKIVQTFYNLVRMLGLYKKMEHFKETGR